jgi:hypothetical protein
MSSPSEATNKYALAAENVDLERPLRHRKDSLVHVDATLRLLDGSIEPDEIPKKRLTKRVKLFRHGQLNRMIPDALREAKGPISAPEIVSYLLKAGGHDESARRSVAPRVRGNLAYLERQRVVDRTGQQREARWRLHFIGDEDTR